MKKIALIVFAMLFLAAGLVGCGEYSSHYHAVGHVVSAHSDSAWMSFIEFEGTEVFKLKRKSGDLTTIRYSGSLETGNLTVYYDCGGKKLELFSLSAGDEIESSGGYLPEDTVYVIVETTEKCCNGALSFEIASD